MRNHYVAITDNADPMNVVVYRRARHVADERRVVCQQPVFEQGASATENSRIGTDTSQTDGRAHGDRGVSCQQPVCEQGASATENSLIGTDNSMIVENNYGYAPP